MARLIPAAAWIDGRRLKTVAERLKRFRQGRRLGDVTIRELIEEGRR